MALQLDLFLDSRSVVLANEAADALVARDADRAARCVASLRSVAPDHPNLRSLESLVRALAAWQPPPHDAAQILSAIESLEQVIVVAAPEAVGAASKSLINAFFRDLAESSRGLPYESGRAKVHSAWLSLRCGDWAEAERAALSIPLASEIPDALHWLTVARYRQRGLSAARPTLFALAWRDPQRLRSVVGELADELLDRELTTFECACDWGEIPAAELPAWFPAWYVLEHPAAAKDIEGIDVQLAPAKATMLLVRILEMERHADWTRLVALREQLRSFNPDLFSLYMKHRMVHYWR